MTEQEFNRIIDNVSRVYTPIVRQKGGNLVFVRSWQNGQVNAQATRQGSTWIVEMFGGMARHPAISSDALALIACHEVGHHLGGAPKYTSQGGWASVEGQSDYFATTKCLRKVFAADGGSVSQVDPVAKSECDRNHGFGSNDSVICQRIAMAGLSAANVSGAPRLNMRDPSRVSRTFESHPQSQCRLDTYFQGAVCPISHNVDADQRNPNIGFCLNGSAQDAGSRPLCWYKPANMPTPTPTPIPPHPPGLPVASTPKLNGLTDIQWTNPQAQIVVSFDVSNIPNVYGVFFEISRPNMPLALNGVAQDPLALRSFSLLGVRGQFPLLPIQVLPNWGNYQIRMIPLDRTGRNPLGQFSNPAILRLNPTMTFK